MNKTANCIEMLQLLSSGKSYKTKELAEFLDTNPRNIPEYKKELEECGYRFESMSGKYGGIKLLSSSLIPSTSFTFNEKRALSFAYSYLSNDKTLLFKDDYLMAMSKLFAGINWESIKRHNVLVISEFKVNKSSKEIEKIYTFFEESIEAREVIKITYLSITKNKIEDRIEPYKLFVKDSVWSLLAYSKNNERYVVIKLNYIETYEKTGMVFSKDYFFDEHSFSDDFESKLEGELYHIKLKIDQSYSYIKENFYGKNQKIEELEDGAFILEFDMRNLNKITSLILSFGDGCEVLSPINVREKVRISAMKIYKENNDSSVDNQREDPKGKINLSYMEENFNEQIKKAINCCKTRETISPFILKDVINGNFDDAMKVIEELISSNYIYKKEKENYSFIVNKNKINDMKIDINKKEEASKDGLLNVLNPVFEEKIKVALKSLKETGSALINLDSVTFYELKELLSYPEISEFYIETETEEVGNGYYNFVIKLSLNKKNIKRNFEYSINDFYKFCLNERYLTARKVTRHFKIDEKEANRLLNKLVDDNFAIKSFDNKENIFFNFRKENEIGNCLLPSPKKEIVYFAKDNDFISISEIQCRFKLGYPKAYNYIKELVCDGWLIKEEGQLYISNLNALKRYLGDNAEG